MATATTAYQGDMEENSTECCLTCENSYLKDTYSYGDSRFIRCCLKKSLVLLKEEEFLVGKPAKKLLKKRNVPVGNRRKNL